MLVTPPEIYAMLTKSTFTDAAHSYHPADGDQSNTASNEALNVLLSISVNNSFNSV